MVESRGLSVENGFLCRVFDKNLERKHQVIDVARVEYIGKQMKKLGDHVIN